MIGMNSDALARNFAITHRSLGLEMPKAYLQAEKNVTKVYEADLSTSADQLPLAIAAAIVAERDPATDPKVVRLLMLEQIRSAGIIENVRAEASSRLAEILRDSVDELIEQWRVPFETASADIERTSRILRDVDLDKDSTAILNRGGDIARDFVTAREANTTIDTIMGAWVTLALATRFTNFNRELRLLIISPIPLRIWQDERLRGAKRTAWQLHKLGLPLELATRTGLQARIKAHETEQDAIRSAWEDEQRGKTDTSFVKLVRGI